MQIRIHLTRLIGKPSTTYTEGLVSDDGARLKTHSVVTSEWRQPFSELWWKANLIPQDTYIATVTKYYFYSEWFDIMELRGDDGGLLGHYSDICAPLNKIGDGEYAVTDLILDLWRFPDGSIQELDHDEFAEAVQRNLLTPELQDTALAALRRLVTEAAAGHYPSHYTR